MTHTEILKMIEEVDPSDTAKLDEIDARVWCWKNKCKFLGVKGYGFDFRDEDDFICTNKNKMRFTRSRDALKVLRPKNMKWLIYIETDNSDVCSGQESPDDKNWSSAPTEELAELHAIIQAIVYERNA